MEREIPPQFLTVRKESETTSFPSLSELEFEVLRDLDRSISYFEENNEERLVDEPTRNEVPATRLEPAALFSLHRAQMFSKPKHLNAGYLIVDGTEMRYISNEPRNPNPNRTTFCNTALDNSMTSSALSLTSPVSEPHLNISSEDLLVGDFFRSYQAPALPPGRFPVRAFLSFPEKFCIFVTGMASTTSFSAFYVSLAYFSSILGVSVLSSIGLCHFAACLVTVALVFCSKKHVWVPFLPTVPLCLALMAAIVAAVPAIVVAGVNVPAVAILGMVTLNGLCSGMIDSLISRMAVLFPGAETGLLVKYGRGLGCLVPAMIQMVLILSQGLEPEEAAQRNYNELCICILFPLVFMLEITGFVSFLEFSRSGIYELFAGKDCAAHSPKNITIGTVFGTAKRRFRRIRWYLLVEFLVAAVSYYVLSLATQVHTATLDTEKSSFARHHHGAVPVGLFKLGNWLGEGVGLFRSRQRTSTRARLPILYFISSLVRLAFVAAAVVLIVRPFPDYHSIFAMALYFVSALSGGYLTIAMLSHC